MTTDRKLNLSEINAVVSRLPEAVLSLMPDDRPLRFLTSHIPVTVTEQNAQLTLDLSALICRRVAVLFDEMAREMESIKL